MTARIGWSPLRGPGRRTFAYDPLGRLYQTGGGAPAVTRFFYDGDRLIAE
jgi:hypothetical protein